jgi:hypothetical protein
MQAAARLTSVIAVVLLSIGLAACGGGTTTSSTPPKQMPAIGTISFDEHLCEVQYTGGLVNNGWENVKIGDLSYCYKQVGDQLYDAYYWHELYPSYNFAAHQPVFRRDWHANVTINGAYVVLMNYSNQVWQRFLPHTDVTEVLHNNAWIPQKDYNAIKAQEVVNKTAAEQIAAQTNCAAGQAQLYAFQERANKAAGIFAQPACNSSYNGCR